MAVSTVAVAVDVGRGVAVSIGAISVAEGASVLVSPGDVTVSERIGVAVAVGFWIAVPVTIGATVSEGAGVGSTGGVWLASTVAVLQSPIEISPDIFRVRTQRAWTSGTNVARSADPTINTSMTSSRRTGSFLTIPLRPMKSGCGSQLLPGPL